MGNDELHFEIPNKKMEKGMVRRLWHLWENQADANAKNGGKEKVTGSTLYGRNITVHSEFEKWLAVFIASQFAGRMASRRWATAFPFWFVFIFIVLPIFYALPAPSKRWESKLRNTETGTHQLHLVWNQSKGKLAAVKLPGA